MTSPHLIRLSPEQFEYPPDRAMDTILRRGTVNSSLRYRAMPLDFSQFDVRHFPTVDVARGYDEWAETYDDVVRDEMDLRLLERLESVNWAGANRVVDLACGTGRIGAWLRARGVPRIDGIDISPQMIERARARDVYDRLHQGDLRNTPWSSGTYDLAVVSLADEHLPDLAPLYAEAIRLLSAGGTLVLVGYHPQFLMTCGMPTHFHRPNGEAVAIETWVHLLSDHVRIAAGAGFMLTEMYEGLVDDEYIAGKPKWARYRNTPVSFALAWLGQQ